MEITRRDYIWLALVIGMAIVWYLSKPDTAPVGEYIPAKVAPPVKHVPMVEITPKKPLHVYHPSAKKKLKLSDEQINNQAIVVVAANQVLSDPHPQTIVTTLDQNTGQFKSITRRDPYPWMAAEQTGYMRIGYGFKSSGAKVVRLAASEDLVQILGWNIGGDGTLDSDAQWYGGVHAMYRW